MTINMVYLACCICCTYPGPSYRRNYSCILLLVPNCDTSHLLRCPSDRFLNWPDPSWNNQRKHTRPLFRPWHTRLCPGKSTMRRRIWLAVRRHRLLQGLQTPALFGSHAIPGLFLLLWPAHPAALSLLPGCLPAAAFTSAPL